MPVWEEKGLPIYAGPDYEKRIERSGTGKVENYCQTTYVMKRYNQEKVPGRQKEPLVPRSAFCSRLFWVLYASIPRSFLDNTNSDPGAVDQR